MSIRTDDLGFVFYEADEQEEKELEYVYAITDSWNYTLDLHPRITDKIERINLWNKERMQKVNQLELRSLRDSLP